jgi:hypothetical protein
MPMVNAFGAHDGSEIGSICTHEAHATGLTVHPSYRRPDSDNDMPCPEGMSNYPEKAGSAETHDTKISVQPQATGRRHRSNRSHPLDPVGRYHSPPPFSVKMSTSMSVSRNVPRVMLFAFGLGNQCKIPTCERLLEWLHQPPAESADRTWS